MIETEQTVLIDAGIDRVWDYVREMQRWASIMPGYREFEIIDADDSKWTLKVGVGGLVRTVKVLVHVEQWDGPERVKFRFKLSGDPVEGNGAYTASSKGPNQTEICLLVQVRGGGPMAPMWEAMGKPLLPQLAKSFAGQLKAEIEKAAGPTVPDPADPKAPPSLVERLRKIWRILFGTSVIDRIESGETR